MSKIEDVFDAGLDAFSNLFDMTISDLPGPVQAFAPPGILDKISLRIKNLSIPSANLNTYDVHYKTMKFTKVTAKVQSNNEFSFVLRLDQNWELYRFFQQWKNLFLNTYNGTLGSDTVVGSLRAPVSIIPMNSDQKWDFTGAFPKNLPDFSFDYSSDSPIDLNITMGFIRMNELGEVGGASAASGEPGSLG